MLGVFGASPALQFFLIVRKILVSMRAGVKTVVRAGTCRGEHIANVRPARRRGGGRPGPLDGRGRPPVRVLPRARAGAWAAKNAPAPGRWAIAGRAVPLTRCSMRLDRLAGVAGEWAASGAGTDERGRQRRGAACGPRFAGRPGSRDTRSPACSADAAAAPSRGNRTHRRALRATLNRPVPQAGHEKGRPPSGPDCGPAAADRQRAASPRARRRRVRPAFP